MKQELKETVSHGTEEYPFALYRVRHTAYGFRMPPHWHEETEIVYVESGILYLTIGEDVCTGKGGDIFLVNAGDIHGMHWERPDTSYVTILFPVSSLLFLNMDSSTREYLIPLSEQKTGFIHKLTDTAAYPRILAAVQKLLELNTEKPPAYQLGTKSCLLDILYQLFSAGLTGKVPAEAGNGPLCREILSYLKENCTGEISLSAAASRFHMSEKYFSRFFKKTFSLTYVDYVNQLRIERAADLLTHSDLPVTEIALRCGFSSCSYFNRRFKELTGVTPRAYRG